jgi:hypothetical protein
MSRYLAVDNVYKKLPEYVVRSEFTTFSCLVLNEVGGPVL